MRRADDERERDDTRFRPRGAGAGTCPYRGDRNLRSAAGARVTVAPSRPLRGPRFPHLPPGAAFRCRVSAYAVTVRALDPDDARFREPVRRAVEAALAAEGARPGWRVAVLLVDDDEIAEHHARFMGRPEPTDVLSWRTTDAPLGDVMISCETARRQAEELGHSWEREVLVLAVHGALHLLGWDDLAPGARERMQRRVDELVGA